MSAKTEEVKKKPEDDKEEDIDDQDQNKGEDDEAEDKLDITKIKAEFDGILDPARDKTLFTRLRREEEQKQPLFEKDFLSKITPQLILVEKDGEYFITTSDAGGEFHYLFTF